ncbi:MAG: Hsp20/alpha crystallin family protein [Acidimicrobiales bacterium]
MLIRHDPFRELDRITQQLWGGSEIRAMPMDAWRRDHEVMVQFDLPGVDPPSIDLTVERNVVTVRAERRHDYGDQDEVLVRERPEGTMSRQIFLGDTLDYDEVRASYEDGILLLTIPVAEASRPRKVEVGGGRRGAEPIEATAGQTAR